MEDKEDIIDLDIGAKIPKLSDNKKINLLLAVILIMIILMFGITLKSRNDIMECNSYYQEQIQKYKENPYLLTKNFTDGYKNINIDLEEIKGLKDNIEDV